MGSFLQMKLSCAICLISVWGISFSALAALDDKSEDQRDFIKTASICIEEYKGNEISLCLRSATNKLAEEGNYVAQYQKAKFTCNKNDAMIWYQTALVNPRISKIYKDEITKRMEELKNKTSNCEEKPKT